jgi:hypothetical protein
MKRRRKEKKRGELPPGKFLVGFLDCIFQFREATTSLS